MLAESERAQGRGARGPRFAIGDRVKGKVVSIGQEVTILELAGGGEGTLDTLELQDAKGQLTVATGRHRRGPGGPAGRPARVRLPGARRGQRGRGHVATWTPAAQSGLARRGGRHRREQGRRGGRPARRARVLPDLAARAAAGGGRVGLRGAADDLPDHALRGGSPRRRTWCCRGGRCWKKRCRSARRRPAPSCPSGRSCRAWWWRSRTSARSSTSAASRGCCRPPRSAFSAARAPSDFLTVGQPVTVQVLRIEKRDDPRRPEQVSFSLKALERDPWLDAAAKLAGGDGRPRRGHPRRAVRRLRRGGARSRGAAAHQRAGRR